MQKLAEAEHGHPLEYAIRRHFFGVVPVFLVDDIQMTCAYYERVLGFEVGFTFGEPADFASVFRNNAVIHLNKADPAGGRNSGAAGGAMSGPDAYVIVNDIDELYEEMRRVGAKITLELVSRDYGMREFQVEDCNEYRLTLAEGIFREH
ncbi:MAG: hypothetical protein GEU75_14685 [Dehalococcoidia bacterium]|nr:hypothetical protein [Dehalococcoidia bacterium]